MRFWDYWLGNANAYVPISYSEGSICDLCWFYLERERFSRPKGIDNPAHATQHEWALAKRNEWLLKHGGAEWTPSLGMATA